VAIPSSTDQQWALALHELSRRGLRPVVVLMDSATFNGPLGAPEISALLNARGIPTYLVKSGDKLDEVLNAASVHMKSPVPFAA
jgi:hypothetical protein